MHDITRRGLLTTLTAVPFARAAKVADPAEYPLFRVKGTHREMGRQHGEQASQYIRMHLDVLSSSGKITREKLQQRAGKFKPMFEEYCPHLLDEMRGIGEGAGVSLEEAMACSIRGEMSNAKDEGCTAYAIGRNATAKREVIAGQNSDMNDAVPPMAYVLHLQPTGKPEVLIWTFGGMLGYHGMNSVGVAHFANALGGGPAGRFGMPHYPIKRMMLECSTVAEIMDLFKRMPVASNGNYVLCDSKGAIADIEATTTGPELLPDSGRGYLAHTNHFVCSRYAKKENFDQSWKDSFPRMERINSLIAQRSGRVTIEDVKAFLRDHSGEPTSICRHDTESRTVASLISEPARRRMHVAVGNPCRSQYVTYSM